LARVEAFANLMRCTKQLSEEHQNEADCASSEVREESLRAMFISAKRHW